MYIGKPATWVTVFTHSSSALRIIAIALKINKYK